MNRAPGKKLWLAVIRRDGFRCRACGRRPADYVDIELHVHHIRPHGMGGLTEMDNLITLCHTCHIGLDPHFELGLYGLVPGRLPLDDFDSTNDRFLESVRRYGQIAARLVSLASERKRACLCRPVAGSGSCSKVGRFATADGSDLIGT